MRSMVRVVSVSHHCCLLSCPLTSQCTDFDVFASDDTDQIACLHTLSTRWAQPDVGERDNFQGESTGPRLSLFAALRPLTHALLRCAVSVSVQTPPREGT